jgi:hypothetical protein
VALVLACVNLAACGDALRSKAGSSSAARMTMRGQRAGVRHGAGRRRPAGNQRLTLFAACVRRNGVNVVVLNRRGEAPRLDLSGTDTSSAQVESAWARCRRDVNLGGAFHMREQSSERLGNIMRH